jgi:phage terminase large subunit
MSVKGFMIQKQLEDLALEKQYFQLLQHWLCVLGKNGSKKSKKEVFCHEWFSRGSTLSMH